MGLMTVTCQECGEEFHYDYAPAPEGIPTPKWCSEACRKEAERQ